MRKLELKELAAYVPYKAQYHFESEDYTHQIIGVDIAQIYLISPFNDHGSCGYHKGKLVLRPLSDFKSENLIGMLEIAIKQIYGYVPEWVGDFTFHGWDGYQFGVTVCDSILNYGFTVNLEGAQDIKLSSRYVDFDNQNSFYNLNTLDLFEYFFKNHFDIFGLIESGLAIDINTLNKE